MVAAVTVYQSEKLAPVALEFYLADTGHGEHGFSRSWKPGGHVMQRTVRKNNIGWNPLLVGYLLAQRPQQFKKLLIIWLTRFWE